MNSLTAEYLDSLAFTTAEINTLKLLKKYREKQALFLQQTPGILQNLRLIAENESSDIASKLENEIKQDRLQQLTTGYRIAFNLIYDSDEKLCFIPDAIQQLHKILCRYVPNATTGWRATDTINNEILFMPTKPPLISTAINTLSKHYANAVTKQKHDALILIPLAILDFLCIQPFAQHNQQIARLLNLMLLYQFDYQVGCYISLDRIFEETKEHYELAFLSSSNYWCTSAHDVKPWLHYFWKVMLRAYKEFEEKIGVIENNRGSKTELIRSAIKRKIKPFSIADIESDCPGISHDMIRRVLRQMRDKGILSVSSNGRGAKWRKVARDKIF